MGHKHLNGAIRVLVVLPFLAASIALAGFAFASSASAAGGTGPTGFSAATQNCDEGEEGCDYLDDYGIGCINGEVVGDVDGTAINCDVDGDVNGDGINTDATGNMDNCINGDPASVSGTSINCGDDAGGYTPAPNPNPDPDPDPDPAPGNPDKPGNSTTLVVALPDTGVGGAATGSSIMLAVIALAAVAVTGFAASTLLGRAED